MRPLRLQLSGFTSWQQPADLYFGDKRLVLITGETGSGKSSILDAILFALFGRSRVGRDLDSVVSHGQQRAVVRLFFETPDGAFCVSRSRQVGARARTDASLTRLSDGGDSERLWGGQGVADVDASIEQLLAMDQEAFESTVFVRQGRVAQFATMTPAQRKELVVSLLRLGIYAKLEVAARQELRAVQQLHLRASSQVEQAGRELEAVHGGTALDGEHARVLQQRLDEMVRSAQEVQEAQERHREAALRLDAVSKRRSQLQEELSQVSIQLVGLQARQRELTRQLADLRQSAGLGTPVLSPKERSVEGERAQALAGQLAEMVQRERELQADLFAAQAERDMAETARRRLEAVGEEPSVASCEVCGQPLSAEAVQHSVAVQTDRATNARQRADALEAELQQLVVHKTTLEGTLQELQERLENSDRTLLARREAQEQMRALAPVVQEVADELTVLQQRREDLERALERLDDEETRRLQEEVQQLWQRISMQATYPQEITRLQREIDEHAARAERQAALQATIAQGEQELAHLKARQEALSWIQRACSPSGIPIRLFQAWMDSLQQSCNAVCAQLGTQFRLILRVEQQRNAPQVVVEVHDGDRRRPYESFSGGERFQIDLALRVALASLLAYSTSRPPGLLAIDEGYDALDAIRVRLAGEMLLSATRLFPLILTISHNRNLAEILVGASHLAVTKDVNGSHAEWGQISGAGIELP